MEGWTEAVAKELPIEWNSKFWGSCAVSCGVWYKSGFKANMTLVHLSNIEPGGVKTKYATSSLKMMEQRHPAYTNPSYPTNALLTYMLDEKSRELWAEPAGIALAMYEIVSRGQKIPIRVPLGSDSWGAIMADLEKNKHELEELKDLSLGVGNPEQKNFMDKIGPMK
jgi:hypothetical protein